MNDYSRQLDYQSIMLAKRVRRAYEDVLLREVQWAAMPWWERAWWRLTRRWRA